jgi:hypothetical protein
MVRRLAALILPSALRDAGNQLAAALGHDEADPPNTYNVPLYPIGGGDEPTHFGTSTAVTEGFEDMILASQQGQYPEWPSELLTLAQSVVGGLASDFTGMDANAREHFDGFAASLGVERRLVSERG